MNTAWGHVGAALRDYSLRASRRVGLQARLFLAFVLVSGFTVCCLFVLVSSHIEDILHLRTSASLEQMANVQERRVNLELYRLQEQLKLLASRTQMRISLEQYTQTGDSSHLLMLEKILSDALQPVDSLLAIWVRNPSGQIVIGVTRPQSTATASQVPNAPTPYDSPIQLLWTDAPMPELWMSTRLTLDERAIGSLLVQVTWDDILAVIADFPSPDLVGRNTLLLARPDQGLHAICTETQGVTDHLQPYVPIDADEINNVQFPVPIPISPVPSTQNGGAESQRVHSIRQRFHTECNDNPVILSPRIHVQLDDRLVLRRPLDYQLGEIEIESSLINPRTLLLPSTRGLIQEAILIVLVSLLLSWAFTRMVSRPLLALSAAARKISHGATNVRIAETGWGQFAELAQGFNHAVRTIDRRNAALETEIRARRRAQRELVNLANTDPLTGLINRRHFVSLLAEQLREAPADAGTMLGTLLYLDLDRFKPVNDDLGHDAGDAVLCLVAERLQHLVREHDRVARLGGDEFAVLLRPETQDNANRSIAERIEDILSQPMMIKGKSIQVGCSIGVYEIPAGTTPQGALNAADAAMYAVKEAKKQASA